MTPIQALELLFKASALAPLNKESHVLCEKAAKILQDLINPAEITPEEKGALVAP